MSLLNVMRIFILGSLLMVCDIVFADYNIAVLGQDTINGSPVVLIDDVSTNFLDDGFNFLGVIGFFLGLNGKAEGFAEAFLQESGLFVCNDTEIL